MKRTKFEASLDKQNAIEKAEQEGKVADSMEYRMELIRKLHAGEMTLEQIQAELKQTKRNAKKEGKVTRTQVWRQS